MPPPGVDDTDEAAGAARVTSAATPGSDASAAQLLDDKAVDLARAGTLAVPASIERWERGLAPRDFSVPVHVERLAPGGLLDPDRWGIGRVEFQERELPHALHEDLRERVPQALLRDLHRPVRTFHVVPEPIEGTWSLGGWRAGHEEFLVGLAREPMPHVEPLVSAVREEQARRRAFLDEPWQPLLEDGAARRTIELGPSRGDEVDD